MVTWKNCMLLITKRPSYNAKKALVKAVIVGIITTLIYLIVVVVTTPSLPPIAAIDAAFRINSIIIFGLAIGVGTQIFISSYSKGLGCWFWKYSNQFIFFIFLFGTFRMLWKLAFDTFILTIYFWKFLISCSNTILKITFLRRPSNCVWIYSAICFQTS